MKIQKPYRKLPFANSKRIDRIRLVHVYRTIFSRGMGWGGVGGGAYLKRGAYHKF